MNSPNTSLVRIHLYNVSLYVTEALPQTLSLCLESAGVLSVVWRYPENNVEIKIFHYLPDVQTVKQYHLCVQIHVQIYMVDVMPPIKRFDILKYESELEQRYIVQ